ncbi:hypothetical protein J2S00_002433 [Caldalkalibacillus uzonensis]|uniref:YqzL family protein n=1 Tax=Caldalkalibacillus uzonensis TaxID=353224 RepID=A0ABU0CVU7_9BACI|nr:YqzL family protein [Caldalkalibacillus uzonensis]MDQ0339645.1 hypothetical protein [Caldalkalibacillus uzonensis]
MRQIFWNVFAATGNIEAYLLYKEYETLQQGKEKEEVKLTEKQEHMEANHM